MEHSTQILFELFLMFAAAKLLGEICERVRQPAVIGEILAGVLLGPYVLKIVSPSELTTGIAEIGVIILLFVVGLETQPSELLRVGGRAALVAVLGVVLPFVGGFVYMKAVSHSTLEAIFIGTALVATSVGITARVMADMHILSTEVARIILGAAVIDDILGMILLAIVSSLSNGKIHYVSIGFVVLEAVAFTLIMVFWGSRVAGRIRPRLDRMNTRNPAFIIALLACLGLSVAASYIGMAAIIGAFLAGLAIADQREAWGIEEKTHALYEFLVPFFFVVMGAQLNLTTFRDRGIMTTALVITGIAILTKLIGCGLGAWKMGMHAALRVGFGMVPRGEVGIIVALVGLRLHTITDAAYSVVIVMTMITTLMTPPVLRLLFKGAK
ncbi:MAG: cation:proton antiporter [Acidobacteriia bacterium]|nr:cation:proton antiporter [Terriglobia bacterium]